MDCEDSYQREMDATIQRAKEIEDQWLASATTDDEKNQRMNLKQTVRSAVVSDTGYRAMGWKTSRGNFGGYPYQCNRCGSNDVRTRGIVAGCRRNGDGYGSDTYTCSVCGLFEWTSYDEA